MEDLAGRRRPRLNDGAQVGIGTMIVFIASILVAAVASAVLIDTSSLLQDRAAQTGQDTTRSVATNLLIKDIVGRRTASGPSEPLTSLEINAGLAPGATDLDLSGVVILLGNASDLKTLTYSETDGPNKYTAAALRDVDGSYTGAGPVLNEGDLVRITITLGAATNSLTILPREDVLLTLLPEVGASVRGDFQTPTTFGSNLVIKLR